MCRYMQVHAGSMMDIGSFPMHLSRFLYSVMSLIKMKYRDKRGLELVCQLSERFSDQSPEF